MPYCSFETRVVTSSCNIIIFAFSNFAELTLFHILADDRQKCYAFPVEQENSTLKEKRLPGNSSKIQVATRKEKEPDISVCCDSERIYVLLSLQALFQSINGYFQENRVRFCAFWNQGHG